jgi:hypothetical protein
VGTGPDPGEVERARWVNRVRAWGRALRATAPRPVFDAGLEAAGTCAESRDP